MKSNTRGGSRGRSRGGDDETTKISKAMSYILRHGAAKEGIEMGTDGNVLVDDLLKKPNFKGVTVDKIRSIVENNDKQRFKLTEKINPATGQMALYIRANQGHTDTSVKAEELMTPITDLSQTKTIWPSGKPTMLHGTYMESWDAIKSQGLSRMARQHVHFAIGEPGEVISGMRKTCDVYLYVDVSKLIQDKVPLFLSANNVLLSPGVGETGIIPPKYFDRAIYVKGNQKTTLWPESK